MEFKVLEHGDFFSQNCVHYISMDIIENRIEKIQAKILFFKITDLHCKSHEFSIKSCKHGILSVSIISSMISEAVKSVIGAKRKQNKKNRTNITPRQG